MSEDFNMVAPKKVLIMTGVPLIIQLPGNLTQNFGWSSGWIPEFWVMEAGELFLGWTLG